MIIYDINLMSSDFFPFSKFENYQKENFGLRTPPSKTIESEAIYYTLPSTIPYSDPKTNILPGSLFLLKQNTDESIKEYCSGLPLLFAIVMDDAVF